MARIARLAARGAAHRRRQRQVCRGSVRQGRKIPSTIAFTDGAAPASLAAVVRGSRVEIVLQPKRFLFRPLELPARAADFIEGIVRAQIDRLTPWSASEAVFGCTAPSASGGESITTTIAATTRKAVTGYVQALSAFHPSAVAISRMSRAGYACGCSSKARADRWMRRG